MLARVQILVTGRVQGVCFRDFTIKSASSFGLTGWVRNLPDGKVEAIAEGERNLLESLISRVRQGPSMSRVEDVRLTWSDWQGEFSDFSITW